MKEPKGYKTGDLPLASYLHAKGMELLGVIPDTDKRRQLFCFLDREDRDELVDNFLSGKDLISASHYFRAMKAVKRKLPSRE